MSVDTARILGIDPGLNVTGHATLFDFGARRTLESTGILAASDGWTFEARLNAQTSSIIALIEEKQPYVLSLELYNYQGPRSHSPNAFWLSRLVGRIEMLAREFNCVLVGVNKQEANKALALTGRVSARRIRNTVDAMFPPRKITKDTPHDMAFTVASKARPRTDHEIDAIAVAIAGAQRWRIIQRTARGR